MSRSKRIMLKQFLLTVKQRAVVTIVPPLFFVCLNILVLFLLGYAFLSPYTKIVASLLTRVGSTEVGFFTGEDFIDRVTIRNEDVPSPYVGTHYGQIEIESVDLNIRLYWGDSDAILDKGAGQYIGSSLPGYRKPLLIGGHNLTYFKPLKDIELGDEIVITTHYAKYVYEVVKLDVVNYLDMEAFDLSVEDEVLMLYTCYPFEILWSRKTDRYVVYGERIKGPDVK